MKSGDKVMLRYREQTVEALIRLASPNGHSLLLEFDELLAGHAGFMPVSKLENGLYRSLVTEEDILIMP